MPVLEPSESIEIPRGDLPPLGDLFSPDHVSTVVLATVGDLLWLTAYVMIIVIGFRQRTYGIPMLAICLNFTWEFVYTVIHPPPNKVTWALHFAWFLVDLLIVFQLFRYGRRHQALPELRRYFFPVVTFTLLLCLAGHMTFHDYQIHLALFPDKQGINAAFLINLIMSILFVPFFFLRKSDLVGLSYPAAWAKMLGTALISLANVLVYLRGTSQSFQLQFRHMDATQWYDGGQVGGTSYHPGFTFFMFAVILVFDVIYILLLRARRREILAESASQEAGSRAAIA